ncbi:MAG: HAD family hydrolase [Nitrososphaeraceae archaeon]
MKIAVFDVCDTLYASNTTFEFLDFYLNKSFKYRYFRKFSKSIAGKLLNYPFLKLFEKDIIRLIATGFLGGYPEQQVNIAAKYFVNNQLKDKIHKNIHELLLQYKAQGFLIILMSGSYNIIVKNVCDYFHADDYFASELEIINEKLSGNYSSDQLFNKKQALLAKYPYFTELVVISDNKTDYQLFEIANEAFAVCVSTKQENFWKHKKIKHLKLIKC